MGKRIVKVNLPEQEGEYSIVLDKLSKFLYNDNNVLYFEYPERSLEYIENEKESPDKESNLVQIRFSIIKYNGENTYIPNGYSYLCTFEDNAHIRYFVYLYDSLSKLFGSFFKDFTFGGLV